MSAKSQKQLVREHLQKGLSITPIEALNKFGAFRLSAIIFLLREEGFKIKTDLIEGTNNRFAKYYLEDVEQINEPKQPLNFMQKTLAFVKQELSTYKKA